MQLSDYRRKNKIIYIYIYLAQMKKFIVKKKEP